MPFLLGLPHFETCQICRHVIWCTEMRRHESAHGSPHVLCGCCCLVAHSCPTLCNPKDCSMPGFPVLHQLMELLKLTSFESVMPSHHLILCRPLLPPSVFPSIRVFSNELTSHQGPKYWSFSVSPSSESSGLISFRIETGLILWFKELSRVFSNTTVQKHQFLGT